MYTIRLRKVYQDLTRQDLLFGPRDVQPDKVHNQKKRARKQSVPHPGCNLADEVHISIEHG